jgi:hypothetical protein
MCWSIIPNFAFFIPSLQLFVTYKKILLHSDTISYVQCIHALYHLKMNNFHSIHTFEIHNFHGQKHI